MQRRLVTVFGGSGFIGRYVVQRLARSGAVVRVAVRSPEQASFLRPMGNVGQVVPTAASIQDPDSITRAVAGADQVINLVGILYERGRRSFEAVHLRGPERLAAAATEAGVRDLVHVSALGAAVDSPSAYARSKALGEDAVLKGFPKAVILRPSVVFGPEDSFLNMFASMARFSPMLPVFGCPPPRVDPRGEPPLDLYGDGGTKFQPVYVADVADAVIAALSTPAAAGRTYALGGPRVYSFKALMELVLRETERRRLVLPVPFWAGNLMAAVLEFLPKPLLTRDQLRLLRSDNVVPEGAAGLADLGVAATPLEAIAPEYLSLYRRGGSQDVRHA